MGLRRFLFLIAIAVAATGALRAYTFEAIYIPTASMEPTLPIGIHLFVDKITYNFRGPSRGDIIAFVPPVPPYFDMVKRVVAVGGDTVELREKRVFLNGKELDENYTKHVRADEKLKGDNLGPIEVPQGYVFVLGDNRDQSDDSSVWKDPKTGDPVYFVPIPNIRGLVRGAYKS